MRLSRYKSNVLGTPSNQKDIRQYGAYAVNITVCDLLCYLLIHIMKYNHNVFSPNPRISGIDLCK